MLQLMSGQSAPRRKRRNRDGKVRKIECPAILRLSSTHTMIRPTIPPALSPITNPRG